MKEVLNVLLVEDNPNDAKLLALELNKNYLASIRRVETEDEYRRELNASIPDIILSDYTLPNFDGMKAIFIRQQEAPLIPFILVTGSINEETAVECIKAGADDYIIKDHLHRLIAAIKSAIEKKATARGKIQAEEALKATNEFNNSLLQTIPFGMDIVDNSGTILFMSEKLKQKFKHEVIGKKCWELYKDDKQQCPECPLKTKIEIGGTSLVETDNVFNGRTFQITHTGTLYDGREAILEIFQDITEKKEVEKEVRLLAHSLESISECVTITDINDHIIYANESLIKTYGYSLSELMGKSISIFRPDNMPVESTSEIYPETTKGGWRGELINRRKDGSLFPILLSTSVIKDENDDPIALIGVAIDISEMKKNTEELIAAKEKAEEMNRLKSSFLANMSHELRTPLIGILGFSEILKGELEKPELVEMVDYIHKGGKRLSDTLNLILDFSNAVANKVQIHTKEVDVVAIAKESIDEHMPKALGKSLGLELAVTFQNALAELDERLFRGVINNLINNAIKFTDAGKVIVEIKKEILAGAPWICVNIRDTGIGIEDKNIDIIFDEFRQVSEGFGRSFEGNGLGLTIAKKITELMGGVISVESKKGIGSVFTVKFPGLSFPTPAEQQTQVNAEMAVAEPTVPTSAQQLPLLLYVDDDDVSQTVVEQFLIDICRTDTASTGKAALQMVKERTYDCFLMDINLGRAMSGIAVTQEIKKMPQYANTPIIAVTAFAMKGDKEEFLEAGCTDYISKPFSKNEFTNLVKAAIRRSGR